MERRGRRISDASQSSSDSWSIIDSRRSGESPAEDDSEELIEDEDPLDDECSIEEGVEAVESCDDDSGSDVEVRESEEEEDAEEEQREIEGLEESEDEMEFNQSEDEEPGDETKREEGTIEEEEEEDEQQEMLVQEQDNDLDDDVSVVDEAESLEDTAAKHFVPAEKINRCFDELSRIFDSPAARFFERLCEDDGRLRTTVLVCVLVASILGAGIGHLIGGSWMRAHRRQPELSFTAGLPSRWVATPVESSRHVLAPKDEVPTPRIPGVPDCCNRDACENSLDIALCEFRNAMVEIEREERRRAASFPHPLPPAPLRSKYSFEKAHPLPRSNIISDSFRALSKSSVSIVAPPPVSKRPIQKQYDVDQILAFLRKHDLVYDVPHRIEWAKKRAPALTVVPESRKCERRDVNMTIAETPRRTFKTVLPRRRRGPKVCWTAYRNQTISRSIAKTIPVFPVAVAIFDSIIDTRKTHKYSRYYWKPTKSAQIKPSSVFPDPHHFTLNVTSLAANVFGIDLGKEISKHGVKAKLSLQNETRGAPVCNKRRGPVRPAGARRKNPQLPPRSFFAPEPPKEATRPCTSLPVLAPPPTIASTVQVPSLLLPSRFQELDTIFKTFDRPCTWDAIVDGILMARPDTQKEPTPSKMKLPPPSMIRPTGPTIQRNIVRPAVCRRAVDHPNKTFSQSGLTPIRDHEITKPAKRMSAVKWAKAEQAKKNGEFKQCGAAPIYRNESIDFLRVLRRRKAIDNLRQQKEQFTVSKLKKKLPPVCHAKKQKVKKTRSEGPKKKQQKKQITAELPCRPNDELDKKLAEKKRREADFHKFQEQRARHREEKRRSHEASDWLFERSRTRANHRNFRNPGDWLFERSRARAEYRTSSDDSWFFERSRHRANYRRL